MVEASGGRAWWREPAVPLAGIAVVVAVAAFPVRIASVFGLPAHPLLLHAPVVLIPEAAGVAVLLAVYAPWRGRFGAAAGVLLIVTMAATLLTAGAGRRLRDQLGMDSPALDAHAALGSVLGPMMIGLTLVFLGLLYAAARGASRPVTLGLAGVVVVLGVAALVWVLRAGASGAEMVWGGTAG